MIATLLPDGEYHHTGLTVIWSSSPMSRIAQDQKTCSCELAEEGHYGPDSVKIPGQPYWRGSELKVL
jgi:hypothetical protein